MLEILQWTTSRDGWRVLEVSIIEPGIESNYRAQHDPSSTFEAIPCLQTMALLKSLGNEISNS